MYHDKTIYILKAHNEESVMGRNFFPGGAPPALTGGAPGGALPLIVSKLLFLVTEYIF